jgi:hypothetical protein
VSCGSTEQLVDIMRNKHDLGVGYREWNCILWLDIDRDVRCYICTIDVY